MANEVFANGREIACKAAEGKSICAFPDVCMTPPENPATPPGVPVPYPNTGMASDTTEGSTTVKITGKEVMLKTKSYFKKSTGDEAGSAAKKGVVTSVNRGKVYFTAWSMDVKFEGLNVVRHLDLTTHNHASMPANTPTWPYIDAMAMPRGGPCSKEKSAEEEACGKHETEDDKCQDDDCRTARKCMLVPYEATAGQAACCPGQTPHHLIEVHCFTPAGGRGAGERLRGFARYDDKKAPCVCCDESSRYHGDHGSMHAIQGMYERSCMDPDGPRSQMGGNDGAWTYGEAKKGALAAHQETFPASDCRDGCTEAQLDAYHSKVGVKDDKTPLRADRSPLTEEQKELGDAVGFG
jgi:hypothetical protein